MEKINLGYSIKNIPIPSERSYFIQLIEKIEAVIKRMRWKLIFYKKNNEPDDQPMLEGYGLKSECSPSQQQELIAFEDDLIQLVQISKS